MNRIILIGNGFDRAHGLETSYQHFVADYWSKLSEKIYETQPRNNEYIKLRKYDEDPFVEFLLHDKLYRFGYDRSDIPPITSWAELEELIERHKNDYIGSSDMGMGMSADYESELVKIIKNGGIKLNFRSVFFEAINRKLNIQKWVDIENEYYRLVKDIHRRQSEPNITQEQSETLKDELKKLNKDLGDVKSKLVDYLKNIQQKEIANEKVNEQISHKIYEPFDIRDISNGGQDYFFEWLKNKTNDFYKNSDNPRYSLGCGYPDSQQREFREDDYYYNRVDGAKREKYKELLSKAPKTSHGVTPYHFFLPENILFLNFNYTRTANLYLTKNNERVQLNHVHGELNNDKNPIIFGYGDEMDEHYKKIADLNENEYMKNIKSIRYLETDNYRRLLTFIDSAPYQIYIMGHSCGNSDRTLLNTLFEHDNCVSIKPFYYQREDGTDDYIDIVQNISRNFKDATLMRDRVVNKTYCEPLPQSNQHGYATDKIL